MAIATDAKKTFDVIKHLFMIKAFKEVGREGKFFNSKPTVDIKSMGKTYSYNLELMFFNFKIILVALKCILGLVLRLYAF